MAVAPLALAGPATAIEPGVGAVPGMAEPLVETIPTEPPAPAELPSSTSSEYFDTPRDLAGCPFRTTPPAPVDESEVPLPGMTAPSPPPAPEAAAGGSALDGCDEAVPEGFEVPQDVTASAWLISDLDTGEVVAARDAHGRYRPASVIKTLLASVVLDTLDPERVIDVDESDLEGAEGSLVGVGPGGEYSVEQLLKGLLMASGNDAATVLAHQMGGLEATVEAMNAHAAEIGATSTYAATVNGLDGPGMMSSAYDMSLIFQDAMTRPAFAEAVATENIGFPGHPAGEGAEPPDPEAPAEAYAGPVTRDDGAMVNPGFVLANDNQLLFNYPGALGGKTGFTDDARHTFIGAAERDGRRLAVVLLDGTAVPASPWQQAAALLDEGFAADDTVGQLEAVPDPASEDAEQLAGGPLGAVVGDDAASSSTVERLGPPAAVGVAGLVVIAGAVLAIRSRRR